MASIGIIKNDMVAVYEYQDDRVDSKCRNDIILLPSVIFDKKFLERLKRNKGPINLLNENEILKTI